MIDWKNWLRSERAPASERERLLGSLRGVLIAFGEHAPDLPDESAAELMDRLVELVARLDADSVGPPSASVLTEVVSARREAEEAFLGDLVSGLQKAVFDVVRSFTDVVNDDELEDDAMVAAVDALADALTAGTPDDVRQAASAAVDRVREGILRRQDRSQAQLDQMGQRLKEMRARVVEAEAKREEDELTRLPNRAALDARLEQEVMVAELTGDPLSVVMLDVDHFKRFNDTHGHAAGDRVLEVVGTTLIQRFLRKSDFSARYGGEEFCVVLSDVSLARAVELADRFRGDVEMTEVEYEGERLRVTCSLGVAELEPGEEPEALMARADAALYASKRAGRNRVSAAGGGDSGVNEVGVASPA